MVRVFTILSITLIAICRSASCGEFDDIETIKGVTSSGQRYLLVEKGGSLLIVVLDNRKNGDFSLHEKNEFINENILELSYNLYDKHNGKLILSISNEIIRGSSLNVFEVTEDGAVSHVKVPEGFLILGE